MPGYLEQRDGKTYYVSLPLTEGEARRKYGIVLKPWTWRPATCAELGRHGSACRCKRNRWGIRERPWRSG